MSNQFNVIQNLLRELNNIRSDVRKARRQAVICEQGSPKFYSLSRERVAIGQERLTTKSSLLSSLNPSIIREGDTFVSLFKSHSSLKSKIAFTLDVGATHVDNSNNIRRAAFTLAEVLITLGIIGVVAALTIPVLIADYQKKETLSKLKKTYSVFSQAVKQAELNEGETEYWDFTLSAKDFYKQYLKNYLNTAAEYIDKPLPKDMDYYTPSGRINNASGGHQSTSNPKIFLNDGTFFTVMSVLGSPTNSYALVVNLNGYSHPNRWGRDIFAFSVVKGKGFVPYGQYSGVISSDTEEMVGSFGNSLNRDKITKAGNTRACNKNQDGIWCAALIMLDGWEIKDDYPW